MKGLFRHKQRTTSQPETSNNRTVDDLLPQATRISTADPVTATPVKNTLRKRLKNYIKPPKIVSAIPEPVVHTIESNSGSFSTAPAERSQNSRNTARNKPQYKGLTPDRLNNALARELGKTSQERTGHINSERSTYQTQRARETAYNNLQRHLTRQNSSSSQSSGISVGYW